MANVRQSYEEFSDMPAALSSFLMSDDLAKAMEQIQASYKLSKEQKEEIIDRLTDTAFNDINLPEALKRIKESLVPATVPEGNWLVLVSDLLKNYAWPLRELFGEELTGVLNEYKINSSIWPQFRVMLKPLTYSGAASEVAVSAGFNIMAGQTRERLRDLIVSRIKGIRTDAQIRETLIRSSDFGGIGLNPVMADKAMEALGHLMNNAEILSEDEYADWLTVEAKKKTESGAPVAAKTEDELEIDKIKANMTEQATPQSVLDKAVEDVYGKVTLKPVDDYLAKRLRYIISSRLRDVRTQFELKQLLERDTKVGGLGVTKEQAEGIAVQIEEGYRIFHGEIASEEKQKLDKQLEEQKVKIEERRKKEAEEHAQWYKEKVLAKKEGEERQKQIAERMKQTFGTIGLTTPVNVHPIDAKEKKAETQKFGELVNAVTAGAAPIAAPKEITDTKPVIKQGVVVSKTETVLPGAQKPSSSSARPEIKVSKATAIMQSRAQMIAKPRMDDVKYAPQQLSGPLQELKSLTLSEFRRLAKDPLIAADKIIERINILGQESFEKRLKGIQAWQACPLQAAYMDLVSESFKTGKQVVMLAEEKRKDGKDVPSPAELSAVISLNSKLHF
ncbi:MAG: hypothetical protein ABIB04_04575 [Patescibacteria group bacterium]